MSASRPKQPNFDPIARPYRWLEYLSFGRALERCRFHFLLQLDTCRNALVIGDGDGRFIARLLAANPGVHADAVDLSSAMLGLLRRRCEKEAANAADRLRCHRMDAMAFAEQLPEIGHAYDLIVTHFFLDCLDQERAEALAKAIAKKVAPGAVWIVSDFRIPAGVMKIPARVLVRSLYLAFRVFTGLRARRLPDHAAALYEAGFRREGARYFLGGLLFTERWSLPHHTCHASRSGGSASSPNLSLKRSL